MPNKIREHRAARKMSVMDLSRESRVSVIQIAMAETSETLLSVDEMHQLCQALGAPIGSVFPEIAALANLLEDMDHDEQSEVMSKPENISTFLFAGIDPDLDSWFITAEFQCGLTRNYPVSSTDLSHAIERMQTYPSGDVEFLAFHSDGRVVVLNRDHVVKVTATARPDSRGDSPWSYTRQSREVVILRGTDSRTERYFVDLDGKEDPNSRQFLELLNTLKHNPHPRMSIAFTDDVGDRHLIPVQHLSLIEIPCGVLNPTIYDLIEQGYSELEAMQPAGNA